MNTGLKSILVVSIALLGTLRTAADGPRQDFFFVEESFRLPPDTTLPGTSTTDVELVDLDEDGDFDLVVGNSGENGEERVFIHRVHGHGA